MAFDIKKLLSVIKPFIKPENPASQLLKSAPATLYDAVDKQIYKDWAVQKKAGKKVPPRVYSDKLIPWLRPIHVPPFGDIKYDRIRSPMTLVFQVKTLGGYAKPLLGLRSSRDFAAPWQPYHNVVFKEFWWRYLGPSKSYQEAKRETARYLDKLYQQIYEYNVPIVAVRVFLVDWSADRAIPASVLKWKVFYTKTFEGWSMDTANLRSWGITADKADRALMKTGKTNGVDYWEYITSDKNVIELETGYKTENIISTALNQVVSQLPKRSNGTIDILKLRRIMLIVRSKPFIDKTERDLIEAFKADDKLRENARIKRNGDTLLINKAVALIYEDLDRRRIL